MKAKRLFPRHTNFGPLVRKIQSVIGDSSTRPDRWMICVLDTRVYLLTRSAVPELLEFVASDTVTARAVTDFFVSTGLRRVDDFTPPSNN